MYEGGKQVVLVSFVGGGRYTKWLKNGERMREDGVVVFVYKNCV